MTRRFITLAPSPRDQVGGQIHLRCPACGETSTYAEMDESGMVCPWCDFHFPLTAARRIELLVDQGSFQPLEQAPSGDSYFGQARLLGRPLALAIADPTTNWSHEESLALAALAKQSHLEGLPLLWAVSAPLGVEETAAWSIVQAAQAPYVESELLWISLLTGPCYGPLSTVALQADLLLAEPGTVIAPLLPEALRKVGHYPAKSIESAQTLLQRGQVDALLSRTQQRQGLGLLFDLLGLEGAPVPTAPWMSPAGDADSPAPLDLLAQLCTPFFELHGDRCLEDDQALVGGVARLRPGGERVMVLVTAQGRSWHEARRRHSGAIGAAGWRKAGRLLRLAGRFGLPVVLIVDQPTVRLQRSDAPEAAAAALATAGEAMLTAPVPIVTIALNDVDDWPSRSLLTGDRIVAREEAAASLQRRGIVPDATAADERQLGERLAQQLQELTQTYGIRGPLGRRKLLERRHARWSRGA